MIYQLITLSLYHFITFYHPAGRQDHYLGEHMPFINVKVAGSLTREQKEEIAKDISETMLRVCNKPKPATYIVFDEVARENWAKGKELLG